MFGNLNNAMVCDGKKQNKLDIFNTNIFIKVNFIHKCPFSFIVVQAFYAIIHMSIDLSVVFRDLHDRDAVSTD